MIEQRISKRTRAMLAVGRIVLASICASVAFESVQAGPYNPYNIIFAIDGQGAVTPQQFAGELQFAGLLANAVPSASSYGALEYFYINQPPAGPLAIQQLTPSLNQLNNSLNTVVQEAGYGCYYCALELAGTMFETGVGADTGAQNILVFITSSGYNPAFSNAYTEVLPSAKTIAKILTVGFGSGAQSYSTFLDDLASSTADAFFFSSESPSEVPAVVSQIDADVGLSVTPLPPTWTLLLPGIAALLLIDAMRARRQTLRASAEA